MKIPSFLLILSASLLISIQSQQPNNPYPVVGILNQPVMPYTNLDPNEYSYFSASYVSFVQGGGGRVAVIPWNAPNLTDYLSAVNGVYLTGGSMNLTNPDGSLTQYGTVLQNVVNFVIAINKERYYPLWGTCQGFEALAIILSQNGSILSPCQGHLCIYKASINSFFGTVGRMFADMPYELDLKMSLKNLTLFDHSLQVDYTSYQQNTHLKNEMKAILYSFDGLGTPFVSAWEHKTLPIYGTQFHPEKSNYEWVNKNINHCYDCIRVSQHLSNFFLQEVRKSNYTFNETEHDWLLIYNFQAEYLPASPFSSMYIFNNSFFGVESESKKFLSQ